MLVQHTFGFQDQNRVLTLSDALAAVSEFTTDEHEVVAVVLHMLQFGSIRLTGAARVAPRMPACDSAVQE